MVKVTQELFDEIKSNKNVTLREILSKYGVSIATASRIMSSDTLDEYKKKGHHKNDKPKRAEDVSITVTDNKDSIMSTTVIGNRAKITIQPKLSLLDRIIKLLKRER